MLKTRGSFRNLIVVLLIAGSWFCLSHTVAAASYQAPDPSFFTPNGSDVLLVASNGGATNGLDSPIIIVMAYFDNPNGNSIVIGNGRDGCGIPGNGSGVDGSGPASTNFTFVDRGSNTLLNSMTRNSSALSCTTDTINVPNLTPYRIPGTNVDKYVLKITANDTTNDSLNAFRISMSPGQGVMSYYDASTRQFAIQDRSQWGPYPGNETTMDLAFAPSCQVKNNTQATLRWYDDDWGVSGGNQSPNLRMELLEDGVVVATNPTSDFTGPNQPGDWTVTIKPGKKYIWRWKGVSERNGIQFQLPYDSFYYNFNCNDPPHVTLDVSCDKLKFRVSDADGENYNVRLRWGPNDAGLADTQDDKQDLEPGKWYEYNLTSRRDFGDHSVSVRVQSRDAASTSVQDIPIAHIGPSTATGPCAQVTCGGQTLDPAEPSPGQKFRFKQTFSVDIGAQGAWTLYNAQQATQGGAKITTIKGGPGGYVPTIPVTVNGPNSGTNTAGPVIGGDIGPGHGDNDGFVEWDMTYNAAGNYGGWVALTGGFSTNCGFTIKVADKPYVRVWRGDVLTGCNLPSATAPWYPTSGSSGKILTWNNGNGTGSGTDFAAQALDTIDQFSSRQNAKTATDGLDKTMTFANTTSNWGGEFGAGQCPSDYLGSSNRPSALTSNTITDVSGLDTGTYRYSNWNVNANTIKKGAHLIIYVDNNVYIKGNIDYAGTGSWASVSDIPSLTLIVKGKILIDKSVSALSGTYIAQPTASGGDSGTIYTCTIGNSVSASQTDLINGCRNSLTVYGSFVARTIKFMRLSGTTSTASPSDLFDGASTAAEKFIYSPEIWLPANPVSNQTAGYDSITSLPPVF